jgi:type I restriction enzyme M protein
VTAPIEFEPDFNDAGKILDFLSEVVLEDTPEERVRQRYLKVLHFDFGYPKNLLRREVGIYSGSTELKDKQGNPIRADIVAYRTATAATKSDQGQIKFVVECKRPDVDSGYNQLVSYIYNTSAAGGVWTNGADVQPFRRLTQPRNHLEAAPRVPANTEEWDAVGRTPKSKLRRPRDVRGLLRLCNNKLHGRGIDGEEEDLTMDMVRIILAKAQDEIEPGDDPQFYVTPEEYATADGRKAVSERVQKLFRKFADDNTGVFTEHEQIGVGDTAITEVVAVLQPFQVMTRLEDADEWDLMGSAYEQYTQVNLKRTRGQYFTNRLVVRTIIEALDPDSDAKSLDPAGGSGGFLTAVLRHVRRKILASGGSATAQEHQLANLRQRLFMVETSPRLVKIAKTAMILNGDGHSGMTKGNSLGPYDNFDPWIQARAGRGVPTLIVTNPPFAGIGDGVITDVEILDQFELARRWATDSAGNYASTGELSNDGAPPEMLFFERCMDWLAPGGLLGIIMPKSFLDTITYRGAREILFRDGRLLAVINLDKNTFQPDTGVRTCILLVQKLKTSETLPADYSIYMAISQKPGRDSEGVPVFTLDANGVPTDDVDEDLIDVLAGYRAHVTGALVPSEYRFTVNRSDLGATLNINPQFHLPHLNETLRQVQQLDGVAGWSVQALSQTEAGMKIFKGARLRTENLIVAGPDGSNASIEPYFPPSSLLQEKRDSIKWLDLSRATDAQLKAFDAVRVKRGDLLVTRSGSIGRVAYITTALAGAIVSDDAIRIRIADSRLRAYVFNFLQSHAAQDQLKINEYGSVQQHLEPHHVSGLLIPIPDDWTNAAVAIKDAQSYFDAKEKMDEALASARTWMDSKVAELQPGEDSAASGVEG